ncbi:MAG TPA: DUF2516 family protein [Mycobacteriales bacterium]|nr:DUF2516 family protein [Mycobacteriales bacterium]
MLAVENTLLLVLQLAALALAVWALADALFRPGAYYPAAGKLTKPAWVAILAVAVLVVFSFGFMGIFGIAAVIASIVYLVDVRPALQALKPGNNPWA